MHLPVRIRIDPEESITSYLHRSLDANELPLRDLPRLTGADVEWARLGVFPDARTIRAIAHVTNTDYATLKSATMHRFALAMPELRRCLQALETTKAATKRTWLWPATTQSCPLCLSERPNLWHLEWRLPWIFECPAHQRILTTHCPECHGLLRERHRHPPRHAKAIEPQQKKPRSSPHPPGVEQTPRPQHMPPWDYGLTKTARARESAAGQRIRLALSAPSTECFGSQVDVSDYLATLRSLASLISHIDSPGVHAIGDAGPNKRIANAPPRSAHTRAALLTRAVAICDLPATEATDSLAALLYRRPRTNESAASWARDRTVANKAFRPVLAKAIDTLRSPGRARSRLTYASRFVPQLFWLDALCALRTTSHASDNTLRCYASMLTVKTQNDSITWIEAGAALGIPSDRALAISRVAQRARVGNTRSLIEVLKTHLPARTVDYRCREQAILHLVNLDDLVQELAARSGKRSIHPHLVVERLWCGWALGHPMLCPGPDRIEPIERQRLAVQRRRWAHKADLQLRSDFESLKDP